MKRSDKIWILQMTCMNNNTKNVQLTFFRSWKGPPPTFGDTRIARAYSVMTVCGYRCVPWSDWLVVLCLVPSRSLVTNQTSLYMTWPTQVLNLTPLLQPVHTSIAITRQQASDLIIGNTLTVHGHQFISEIWVALS